MVFYSELSYSFETSLIYLKIKWKKMHHNDVTILILAHHKMHSMYLTGVITFNVFSVCFCRWGFLKGWRFVIKCFPFSEISFSLLTFCKYAKDLPEYKNIKGNKYPFKMAYLRLGYSLITSNNLSCVDSYKAIMLANWAR